MSTVARRAGGPACSSDEAPVMGVERRGRAICGLFVRSTGAACPGRSCVERAEVVREVVCHLQVGSLGGVRAGQGEQRCTRVDEVTLGEFETDLKGNLYKIWNRMSSGSYLPPPVKAVRIPKPHAEGSGFLACRPSGTGSPRRW
jgi:hypothetical protein